MIVSQNSILTASITGIASFQVGSDGKLAPAKATTMNSTSPTVNITCVTTNGTQNTFPVTFTPTPVVPGSLAIDSAGKYLFVADVATSGQTQPYTNPCNGATETSTLAVPGAVSVFAVSSGTLTEVAGSPFPLPNEAGGNVSSGNVASASALAVTPTSFPSQFAPCSLFSPPTFTPPATEYLYVADLVNNVVLTYSVSSTGALTLDPYSTATPGAPTGTGPSGVAVDPCNRFVYVSNFGSNSVSAFTICNAVTQNCQSADYSLQPVTGSPFPAGDKPGPLAVYPFGTFLYVVDTGSGQVSPYQVSSNSGSLTPIGNPVSTNQSGLNSITILGDGTWMFIANFNSSTVSQFAITPANGTLSPQSPFTTQDNPTGVAAK